VRIHKRDARIRVRDASTKGVDACPSWMRAPPKGVDARIHWMPSSPGDVNAPPKHVGPSLSLIRAFVNDVGPFLSLLRAFVNDVVPSLSLRTSVKRVDACLRVTKVSFRARDATIHGRNARLRVRNAGLRVRNARIEDVRGSLRVRAATLRTRVAPMPRIDERVPTMHGSPHHVVCESGMQGVYSYPVSVAPTRSRSVSWAFICAWSACVQLGATLYSTSKTALPAGRKLPEAL
jgi:hypothetical protein